MKSLEEVKASSKAQEELIKAMIELINKQAEDCRKVVLNMQTMRAVPQNKIP